MDFRSRDPWNRGTRKSRTVVASFLLVVGLVCVTSAEDLNPLKLPTPNNTDNSGTVVLHGGGELSDEIFETFVRLAGGKNARIILIPSGTYVRGRRKIAGPEFNESEAAFEARMRDRFGAWVGLQTEGRITDFKLLYTDDREHMDKPEFVTALRTATGVWIPAAYQGKLAWRFTHRYPENWETNTESLFQRELREVVARGGVVGGAGGGMAALPELMILGDSGQQGGPAEADIYPGLALFTGAIVEQNFNVYGGRLERFTDLLKDTARLNRAVRWPAVGRNMIGLAVEREAALLLRGNNIQAIGNGRGHVFLKGNGDRTVSWRILSPVDGKIELVSHSIQHQALPPREQARVAEKSAQQNPFGMPVGPAGTPRGTVVLHGGGGMLDMLQAYPRLAGVAKPKFVHCPAASSAWRPKSGESSEALVRRLRADLHEWVSLVDDGRLASIDFLSTAQRFDANRETFVAPLRTAHAVWFSGGDQSVLSALFVDPENPTLFQRELFNVFRRGGVVGGTSAGTAIMAKIMTVSGEPRNGLPAEADIDHGFGVLNNVILEQHFRGDGRGGRIERFTRLLLDNDRLQKLLGNQGPKPEAMIGLAIEEETALLLQENRLRVFGEQSAHVFLKSADQKAVTWHELQPGDSAFVYFDEHGPVLELDDWRVR